MTSMLAPIPFFTNHDPKATIVSIAFPDANIFAEANIQYLCL